jgi:hypothetical protein
VVQDFPVHPKDTRRSSQRSMEYKRKIESKSIQVRYKYNKVQLRKLDNLVYLCLYDSCYQQPEIAVSGYRKSPFL